MARRATGQVIERPRGEGRTFALRFRAYGRRQFLTLGSSDEGWTRQRAEAELRYVLTDVERGVWAPELARPAEGPVAPTFHEFASEWLESRRAELRPASVADYSWQLCNHLLPFFHRHRLPQITVAEVDRYRDLKVREGILGAESINKTITRLGQILAVAEERDLIARNPVRVNTRNRTLKTKRRRPVFLDSAEQIAAMIEAATELDAKPEARTAGRRALIATLIYAGLRIGEATSLRWRDINLANGRISVSDSKTEAGIRLVDILSALRDELASHWHAATSARPDDLGFLISSGSRRDKDNARERVIRPVVAAADELLARRGREPLSEGVTAHKVRHTFASILYARGEDPAYVMAQLGHTDPGFTLRVYAHAMRRDEGDKERLRALVEGRDWAPMGTGATSEPLQSEAHQHPENSRRAASLAKSSPRRGPRAPCRGPSRGVAIDRHQLTTPSPRAARAGRRRSGRRTPRARTPGAWNAVGLGGRAPAWDRRRRRAVGDPVCLTGRRADGFTLTARASSPAAPGTAIHRANPGSTTARMTGTRRSRTPACSAIAPGSTCGRSAGGGRSPTPRPRRRPAGRCARSTACAPVGTVNEGAAAEPEATATSALRR